MRRIKKKVDHSTDCDSLAHVINMKRKNYIRNPKCFYEMFQDSTIMFLWSTIIRIGLCPPDVGWSGGTSS